MMSEQIKTEYKGFELIFKEWDDYWYIGGDRSDSERKFEKLSDLKIYIDEILKTEFVRFKVIHRNWSEYKIMTVTSKPDDNNFWLINEDNKRIKAHIKHIFMYNQQNIKILEAITIIEQRMDELKDQRDELAKKLQNFSSQANNNQEDSV